MGILENKVGDFLTGQRHVHAGADAEEIIVIIIEGHIIEGDILVNLENVTVPALLQEDFLKDPGDLFRITGHRLI
jgi:hypothetical protein